jgi:osmotically-inducible protein OsmY
MRQNNRYDCYQDDDNRSFDYRRQQYNNPGRNFDDSWDDDQSRYPEQHGPGYNRRSDYRSGQYSGNDWQENNWRTGDTSRSGQDYDNTYGNYGSAYGTGYDNEPGRQNRPNNGSYEGQSQSWNSRNWGDRNEDWNYYNRGDYRRNDRGWWDKTSDEVSSWFGDDDAKRRRRMDRLNERSHYGKGPKNYKRSQEKIKEDINERLSDDDYLDASDIEVEVNGTEVTLIGTVDSRHAKHRAEDLAEWVSGVTYVQNNLRIISNADGNTVGSSSSGAGSESIKGTAKNTSGTSLTNSRTGKEQHLNN